jgi:hypothetical protein
MYLVVLSAEICDEGAAFGYSIQRCITMNTLILHGRNSLMAKPLRFLWFHAENFGKGE